MNREIVGKQPNFRPAKQTSVYRAMFLVGLIMGGTWLVLGIRRGQVKPLFQPTPTPTRLANSYILEAQAYFDAGKIDDPSNNITGTPPTPTLDREMAKDPDYKTPTPTPIPVINDAIEAYRAALKVDPQNAHAYAELARIQAYSSNMLRNDTERMARLQEALDNADRAAELAPDDSYIRAVRAFVLDWYAFNPLVSAEESQDRLRQAESEAQRAYQIDPNNALALAFYTEILVDQQKWEQAEKYAAQAVALGPNLMDTHRAKGYYHESVGQYNSAIKEYLQAAEITPNMTFLYVLVGRLFREGIHNPDRALEYFDQAARINEQLGVQNPLPYIEIAKTYTQQGQFLVASQNAKKALSFDPANASTYGQLGIIYIRARNYEGAMPLLKCAVRSCTAQENELGLVAVEGLPLTNLTIAYYYVEYGTVLAFLSKNTPQENFCPEARQVLQEVRSYRPDDATLISIVEDSEGLCRRVEGGSPVEATPDLTATPAATSTP